MPKRRMPRHSVTQPLDKPYRFIALTQGQNAIVDAADFEWLNQWNWCAIWSPHGNSFIAIRGDANGDKIRMHRVILGCGPEEEGDHRNRNTLDNRRENLRKCNHAQNVKNTKKRKQNTSGFKGVTFNKCSQKWQAQIQLNGKNHHLGLFLSPEPAAHAYDKAAKELHGEFAVVNFP